MVPIGWNSNPEPEVIKICWIYRIARSLEADARPAWRTDMEVP
jgi:hypothetical protein